MLGLTTEDAATLSTEAVVAGSFLGWHVMEKLSHGVIGKVRPKMWATQTHEQRRDLAVSWNGFLHSIISCALALYITNTDLTILDTDFGRTSPISQRAMQISLGYFLWDLSVTPRYGYSMAFTIHAVLGILATGIAQAGIVTNWVIRYVLYELSTPALHVRQYFISTKQTDTAHFFVADWCFRLSYVAVRCVYGTYLTYKTMTEVLPAIWSSTTEPTSVRTAVAITCGLSIASYTLNQFWLIKMIRASQRRAQSKSRSKTE